MGLIKSHELHTMFLVVDKETKNIVDRRSYDSRGISVGSPQFDDKANFIVKELEAKYPKDKYEIQFETFKE